ncbi:DNA/RNA non-specific endonuclease [Grimontia sp. SpTr1]|uniref:DNA/RNA non-specific endonuclease n=1 Tax=Grimontia sp. SpTr1 TaxID=2995319 RepID=UPI00248B1261|nr:DNA/RNA non-specific endonuclease [Grimontia sp. SpTr1]
MNSATKLAALLLFSTSVSAADIYSPFCPLGCPEVREENNLVFTHIYALSNNPTTKFADWTAYEVNVLNFGPGPGRDWMENNLIPDEDKLEERDYDGAYGAIGMERGHMTPLAAFAGNEYWWETNYISNIVPQHKHLNGRAWEDLEEAVRHSVEYKEPVYVVTGTLYEKMMKDMPNANEEHQVPSGFYKLIYDIKGNGVAFVMEQDIEKGGKYCDTQVKVSDLENRLDYQLPAVAESTEMKGRVGC